MKTGHSLPVEGLEQYFFNHCAKMKLLLFTDGSVNTKLRVGYGAYLAFPEGQQSLTDHIKLKLFEDTSSSKMELQTLLWALSEISALSAFVYRFSKYRRAELAAKKIGGNRLLRKEWKTAEES